MSLANVSIKRPIFITCVMIGIMVAGFMSFKKMSIDLYPEVSIPVVTVQTIYEGAGPAEIENLVSRPLEDEISSISGIKRLTSRNLEGVSIVIVEFNDNVDAKYAEQQVRDKVNVAKPNLPDNLEDSVIKKYDPADSPILMVSLSGKGIGDAKLFDIADEFVKPRLEQVDNVGAIDIIGGRKREIHVVLDRAKLKSREISVGQVAGQIGASGENIPSGKVNRGEQELVFRGLGEFSSVPEVSDTLVNLHGNEVPTRVADLGKVNDTLEDEKSRGFMNGEKTIILQVYRQAGSNTLAVADGIRKQLDKISVDLKQYEGSPEVKVLIDTSTVIRDNVYDVYETIIIGILLTVITVFFFLGSARTTLITALSLPLSLVGSFILLGAANFSINIVSLLALTLAVGLLIDDAIVVIENIYRFMEKGYDSQKAASEGTGEIQMAAIAITLVVMAVFVPVAMMSGTIGQFLKQFGLTVAFSMAISLFVALTIIPMLAAYFGGDGHGAHSHDAHKKESIYDKTLGRVVKGFDRFQTWLENIYEKFVRLTLRNSLITLGATLAVFIFSLFIATKLPGEFVPDGDSGEIEVTLELKPGSNLDATTKIAHEVDAIIKKNKEVNYSFYFTGNINGEANKASFVVKLNEKRPGVTTLLFQQRLREQLAQYKEVANPIVKGYEVGGGGGGGQPVTLNLISADPKELEVTAMKLMAKMKTDSRFKDIDSNYKTGKPELQIKVKPGAAKEYGINTKTLGAELRAQVEGSKTAKFRESGREYDVRVRLQEKERDLKENYANVYVPNVNGKLVRLSDVADGVLASGPASIERQNRARYIQLTSGIAPGVGLSEVVADLQKWMAEGDTKLPSGVRYTFAGDAENMADLVGSTLIAVGLGVLVIYLILSSLYESFITPMTIMISLPLAISGAFFGLYLTGKTINLFAIFGVFMLIGVAGKNGILVVDYAKQLMDSGVDRFEAIVAAGKTRLRPILMTSFALMAGTLPIAIGLNPASRTRTSMGVVIVAGVALSTVLTLIAIPALFMYIDRFRVWANSKGVKFTSKKKSDVTHTEVKETRVAHPTNEEEVHISNEPLTSK